ncbi:MAG TPA: NADPH:quinone reductase [Dongiaceae bacterium]|jgi:NADPH2:quinone reductase|nr:NADPH:quinone reductase [Dongiaceae bacterium]
MKAAFYDRNGSADEVLQVAELPIPTPGPGEVLVRIKASGVNPSDVKSRTGLRAKMSYPRVIPHSDGAGVIEAIGAGVDPARVGERVWLWNGQWQRPFGTAAEYIALPSFQAPHLPDGVPYEAGACLGIPAMTAHRCVFADGPVAGQTILVTGGAGAVGHYAIQLARWGGARVIATVSGADKAAHAKAAGADYIVNYKSEEVAQAVKDITKGQGADRVIEVEFGGNLQTTLACLKINGVIATYASSAVMEPKLPFYAMMFQGITLRLVLVYILPEAARRQSIQDINQALVQGALVHAIAETYPLDRIAEAHQAVESGNSIGNVVVTID